jgi:quinol monooxygenase YgiN
MQAMLPEQGGGDGPERTITERPTSTKASRCPSRKEPHMHARVNTAQIQPDQIDEAVAALRALVPRARQQAPGLKSALVAGDRRTGKTVIVSVWESEAAWEAGEPLYQEAMRELGPFLAEPPTREGYEVLLQV